MSDIRNNENEGGSEVSSVDMGSQAILHPGGIDDQQDDDSAGNRDLQLEEHTGMMNDDDEDHVPTLEPMSGQFSNSGQEGFNSTPDAIFNNGQGDGGGELPRVVVYQEDGQESDVSSTGGSMSTLEAAHISLSGETLTGNRGMLNSVGQSRRRQQTYTSRGNGSPPMANTTRPGGRC